jgi:S1-C subfamily serine protease
MQSSLRPVCYYPAPQQQPVVIYVHGEQGGALKIIGAIVGGIGGIIAAAAQIFSAMQGPPKVQVVQRIEVPTVQAPAPRIELPPPVTAAPVIPAPRREPPAVIQSPPVKQAAPSWTSQGWIGVLIQNIDPSIAGALGFSEARGVIVAELKKNGPADRAGLRTWDVIFGVNGRQVATADDVVSTIKATRNADLLDLNVLRAGEEILVTVTVRTTPHLGITLVDAPEGVKIGHVKNGSPAEKAGLYSGDIILLVGDRPIKNNEEVQEEVRNFVNSYSDRPIMLRVQQGGEPRFVAVRID